MNAIKIALNEENYYYFLSIQYFHAKNENLLCYFLFLFILMLKIKNLELDWHNISLIIFSNYSFYLLYLENVEPFHFGNDYNITSITTYKYVQYILFINESFN